MTRWTAMIVALALGAAAGEAAAQVVGLGTTQAGGTAQLSEGVAKIVSEKGGLQMRTQAMAGAAQYLPLVNNGELEFGMVNIVEALYAQQGQVILEGRPSPDLRLVARLVPWVHGLVVAKDSPIRSVADLKNQSVPYGFSGNPLGRVVIDGYLATAGLTANDVKKVLVPSFPRMFDLFDQRQTVTTIYTVGTGRMRESDQALGGIRYLSFDSAPRALEAMRKHMPQAYFVEVQPSSAAFGVVGPTTLIAYDYVIVAGAKTPDATVAKTVEALYGADADLKALGPLWRDFDPRKLGVALGMPYHPAAERIHAARRTQ